jgi:hypothetical protein
VDTKEGQLLRTEEVCLEFIDVVLQLACFKLLYQMLDHFVTQRSSQLTFLLSWHKPILLELVTTLNRLLSKSWVADVTPVDTLQFSHHSFFLSFPNKNICRRYVLIPH